MFARGILSCGPGRMCSRCLTLSIHGPMYKYICTQHTHTHTHVTHAYRGRAHIRAAVHGRTRYMCGSHRPAEDAGCFAPHLYCYHLERLDTKRYPRNVYSLNKRRSCYFLTQSNVKIRRARLSSTS